jgi:hypothetical protein
MAMASVAIDTDPAWWDRAFALADRIERVDSALGGLAPLRTRLNLLASGIGVRLESDVRPHLRGLTGCVYGDPARPGRVAGVIIVLHLDDAGVADRLVSQSSRRIGGLASGRSVDIRALGRDIQIVWGEAAARSDRGHPAHSLAATCAGWAAEGREEPARVGAVWPARLLRPAGNGNVAPPALHALADDPPVIWWGWSEPAREYDVIHWTCLRERVRHFLDALPFEPAPPALKTSSH